MAGGTTVSEGRCSEEVGIKRRESRQVSKVVLSSPVGRIIMEKGAWALSSSKTENWGGCGCKQRGRECQVK